MVCIDSDIIIDFLMVRKKAIDKISELKEREILTTTSINVFEILAGLSRFNKGEEGYDFVNNIKILDFDYESSENAAKLSKSLKEIGQPIDVLDLFIASVAITNNEKLLTRNKKHFSRIPELELPDF
jgi:predicted nucleic acid-binding protein